MCIYHARYLYFDLHFLLGSEVQIIEDSDNQGLDSYIHVQKQPLLYVSKSAAIIIITGILSIITIAFSSYSMILHFRTSLLSSVVSVEMDS